MPLPLHATVTALELAKVEFACFIAEQEGRIADHKRVGSVAPLSDRALVEWVHFCARQLGTSRTRAELTYWTLLLSDAQFEYMKRPHSLEG